MMISIFDNPKKNKSSGTMSLIDFLQAIKFGKWKEQIKHLRNEINKNENNPEFKKIKSDLKTALPCVTISSSTKKDLTRSEANIETHTGYICLDLDKFTASEQLKTDPYVFSFFESCTGSGIAVIVKINKEKHKDSFNFLRDYFFNNYGITQVDPAPSNPISLRFVSFDENLYLNEKSKTSGTKKLEIKKHSALPIVCDESEVAKAVFSISSNVVNQYHLLLQQGFAIANGFGENGRSWFHHLASFKPNYNTQFIDKQYNACLSGASKSGVTVGSFYWLLKENGIKLKSNEKAIQSTALSKKQNKTKEQAVQQLVLVNDLSKIQAEKLVEEVYNRDDIDIKEVAKSPKALINSLIEWLHSTYGIRQNEIDKKYYDFKNKSLDEQRLNSIVLQAQSFFDSTAVTEALVFRCIFSESTPFFNPFTDFYEKNEYSGEVGLVDKMCKTIISKTKNKDIFLKKWLVSLYGAMKYEPIRNVPLFVGAENCGKTKWFTGYNELEGVLPKELENYCTSATFDLKKENDIKVLLTQKLIVLFDDIIAFNTKESRAFKEFATLKRFSCRLVYEKFSTDFKRLGAIAQTSNEDSIISQETGYTRQMPIKIEKIDFDLFNSIDRVDLMHEIKNIYESGFNCELTEEEIESLKYNATEFEVISQERGLLERYFTTDPTLQNLKMMNATDAQIYIFSKCKIHLTNHLKIGREMRLMFGNPHSVRSGGVPTKKYKVFLQNVD